MSWIQGRRFPGATISALHTGTGLERGVTSEGNGFFVFGNLPVGVYSVSAEHSGFKRITESDLLLGAGAKVSVRLTLEVGSVSESVDVKATAATRRE